MTTSQSCEDGAVSEAEHAWLQRLASDGFGMIVTCAAAISTDSIAFHRQMSLGDDRFLPGLTALAAAMGAHPTLSVVQLCHAGSRALGELTGRPARSASAYTRSSSSSFVAPAVFTVAELDQVVEDFAAASERAARAGFGGIELHGANGYLFTQFISTQSNQRTDAYGGSLENRARLARDVVRAVRQRVPTDFVVGFRMSFEGFGNETGLDLDDNIRILNWLADDGIDYGHVSHMDFAARSVKYPDDVALTRIRAGVQRSLPIVCAGGVMQRADAERALALGADVVAVGRGAVGNDRVPERFAHNEPLVRTPYDAAALARLAVSPHFIDYMLNAGPLSSLHIVASW